MNVVGVEHGTVDEVDGEHFARPETPFLNDVFLVVLVDTDF